MLDSLIKLLQLTVPKSPVFSRFWHWSWPIVCAWDVIYGEPGWIGPLSRFVVLSKSSAFSWVCFPIGAGGQIPQFFMTVSKTDRGDGGAGITTPTRAPPERKARGGASLGRKFWGRAGAARPRRQAGREQPYGDNLRRLRRGLDRFRGWAKEGEVLTCLSGFKGRGRGTPRPARRAPPPAPPPPCFRTRRRGPRFR